MANKEILANQATATRRRIYFHLVDVIDGFTPRTAEAAGQPQISTNGGAFTNAGIGTLVAIGNGRYYADLTAAAVANIGDSIETRYKSANTAECPGDSVRVVAFDPDDAVDLGLTNLDVATSTRSSHTAANVRADMDANSTKLANLDATISSRSTYAGADTAGTTTLLGRIAAALTITGGKVDVNDKTGFALSVAGIAAMWDALLTSIVTAGSIGKLLKDNIDALISSRSSHTAAAVRAEMDANSTKLIAIDAKTTNLPPTPAAVGSAMTLTVGERTAIANAVEAEIIDETDSEKVLTAITDKIAAVNPSLGGLTLAAIAAAVRDISNAAPAAGSLGERINQVHAVRPASIAAAAADIVPAATIAAAVRDISNSAPAAASLGAGIKLVSDRAPVAGVIATVADLPAAAPTAAAVRAEMDANSAKLIAIDAKTTNLPPVPASAGSAMALTVGERATLVAYLLDLADSVEPGVSLRKVMRILLAGDGGQTVLPTPTTFQLRSKDGVLLVSGTMNADGERSAIVYGI